MTDAAKPKVRTSSTKVSQTTANQEDGTEYAVFRKTKIVCTIGPKTSDVDSLVALMNAGMNVARMNFSHGTHESHLGVINNVRAAAKQAEVICAIMLDTKGPEIRTLKLKTRTITNVHGVEEESATVVLAKGQTLTILCGPQPDDFRGDAETIALDYANLPKVVAPGSAIKIDDGLICCEVVRCDDDRVTVTVLNDAELGQNKGVNLPGTVVDLPAMTEKDKRDLLFGLEHGVDAIAASFTRKAEDVVNMRALLGDKGANIKIICKIENQEGLDNFGEILAEADGIMVARGDLGVEIPIQKVALAQKMMIEKCNIAGKPVITATQMLDSMIYNPRPTRAEVTDVANAVFDGTDCVMLSGETAKGAYPVQAVTLMSQICATSEQSIAYDDAFATIVAAVKRSTINRTESITSSAVRAAADLHAPCIVVLTETGTSARFVSKYVPSMPVITLTGSEQTARTAMFSRALFPIVIELHQDDRVLLERALSIAQEQHWVSAGDQIILVSGVTRGKSGGTNTMQVMTAE